MSAAEAAQLAALAARVGLKPGSFLRVAALGTVPRSVPAVNQEKWVELARTASNLNQLTRALQRGVPVTIPAALLEALRVELHATRCALLGRRPDGKEADLPTVGDTVRDDMAAGFAADAPAPAAL